MKTYSHIYSTKNRLETFLSDHAIVDNSKLFIQVFCGAPETMLLQIALNHLAELLPLATVMATTTAGEIIEGGLTERSIIVSFSLFDTAHVSAKLYENLTPSALLEQLKEQIRPDTKMLILFNNTYGFDAESLMVRLAQIAPDVMIAGGNAADNFNFAHTTVAVGTELSDQGIAIAALSGTQLHIYKDAFFNWSKIGKKMTITKSSGNQIFTLNGVSAQEKYAHYLGAEVASNLPHSGIEFPLIFSRDGLDIARAPIATGEDGSIFVAGNVTQGDEVQFGFGDIQNIEQAVKSKLKAFSQLSVESIFIYSCSARKVFLKHHLETEFHLLEQIAPTTGFITYGEFFTHNQCHVMLNASSVFFGLTEDLTHKPKQLQELPVHKNARAKTLDALIHLVTMTAKDLERSNYTTLQFQKIIQDATIYSKTNPKGIILDANENFVKLSGYSKEELIGKPHNIVRHPDMPKSTYAHMWATLQSKRYWQGIIKNRAKDGRTYYVRSHVMPMLDLEGNIKEYISIRDDITSEMEKELRLEGTVNFLEGLSNERAFAIEQYEQIVNLSSAFFRVDTDMHITYVNDVFATVNKRDKALLEKLKITDIIDEGFLKKNFVNILTNLDQTHFWKGVIHLRRADDTLVFMDSTINAIYDKNTRQIIEYMVVQHDITDLILAHQEIENTQRDIVYTMGAIGETRSQETGNHVKRVAEYSKQLALLSKLSLREAELLKIASPMHDIGKVGIPDAILNKPGKLTSDEFVIMQTHAALGYQMLKHSNREILQLASVVAYTHHEKWDGSGYPQGLLGEAIPIQGRITALADVFDALGSDRCYKKAWPLEKVLDFIQSERGKHFDPTLVDLFLENLETFLTIREQFKDE